jgi:hypothetical protein
MKTLRTALTLLFIAAALAGCGMLGLDADAGPVAESAAFKLERLARDVNATSESMQGVPGLGEIAAIAAAVSGAAVTGLHAYRQRSRARELARIEAKYGPADPVVPA